MPQAVGCFKRPERHRLHLPQLTHASSPANLASVDAWASRLRIPRVVGTKPVRGCAGSRSFSVDGCSVRPTRPPPPPKAAVLAGRGNRPHPSTPCGRPKRCRVSGFPPIVHESGTARPDEFSSLGRGPGGMTEHDHLERPPRARLPGRRRINTATPAEVAVMAVLGQGRHLAQHRRHDRGGGDGGLGARPPPLSTPPPRQRWWCWRSWARPPRSTPPLSSWRRCCHSPAGRRLDAPSPRLSP